MVVKNDFVALRIFSYILVSLHRELNCNDGVYNRVTSTLRIDCTSQGKEQSNIASFQGRDEKHGLRAQRITTSSPFLSWTTEQNYPKCLCYAERDKMSI